MYTCLVDDFSVRGTWHTVEKAQTEHQNGLLQMTSLWFFTDIFIEFHWPRLQAGLQMMEIFEISSGTCLKN